jgi:Holliday junction resolvase YEN1
MDMFTRKSKNPSASQQSLTKPPPSPPRRQPKAQSTFDDDLDSDSSSDLVPLSSLVSRASASPKRQQESLPPSRNSTPSPAPARKKKLLIPRASAVGFFKEVEVDAEERDELMARETATLRRKGVRANVVRVSDVGFIDLTQDD